MPLAERDINTQHELIRNKRHSIQPELAYTRVKDENSPVVRAVTSKTTTPPSQRLLAPTKASAAKVTSTPRAAAGPSSPQQQSHSKLPRRTTPTPTSKWSARVAERVSSAEKAATEATELQKQRADVVPIPSHQLSRQSSDYSEWSDQSYSDSPYDKPLPAEKPLPSKPVASLVNAMSPSKDSRTLMDASDRPLTISVAGCQHVWPALTPRSASSGATEMLQDDRDKHKTLLPTSQNASVLNTTRPQQTLRPNVAETTEIPSYTTAAGPRDESRSERSSSSTFVSASDANPGHNVSLKREEPEATENWHFDGFDGQHEHSTSTTARTVETPGRRTAHPARKASLGYQSSREGLNVSLLGSNNKANALNSVSQHARTVTPDSRPHSPSPASFSRPRPSSISHGRGMPSPALTTPTATTPLRSQKTASRIPIPDSKKAMLVDVKSGRSSGAATSKSDQGLSYDRRRLDAPDALKILDQGVKRRQLKRTDTMGTATTGTSAFTKASTAMTFPDHDRSSTSTPDHTFATSSSEEEELITPTYKPQGFTEPEFSDFPDVHAKGSNQHTNSYYHGTAARLFDGAVTALSKTPPPTSQFTGPLQTIHSQAVLPPYQPDPVSTLPAHKRQPSDLDSLKKRLSILHRVHVDHATPLMGERAPVPESTRFSLMELLNEYAREDAFQAREGESVLDQDAKKHITRTLSLLEGKGSPPKTEVDNETLLALFGHLKRGLEKPPKNASFVDNVAAAEKFLAQADGDRASAAGGAHVKRGEVGRNDNIRRVSGVPQLPPIEPMESKWSESTVSLQGLSPIAEGVPPRQTTGPRTEKPIPPPKRLPPDPPTSIGYPSRISGKANTLIGPGGSGAPGRSEVSLQGSASSVGKRTPGSVRAARETLQQVKGGFARTTASAESKKTAKMPTPHTRAFNTLGESRRGRTPSAEKPQAGSEATADAKTLRGRSRSRYMLDKINGLFSTKRDKRNSAVPSVPPVAELEANSRNVEVTAGGSPVMRAARAPPITKMPTMSPTEHPALRNTSSAGTTTSIETPADSVITFDEPQSAKSLQEFSAALIRKAKREKDIPRKERLLTFAKVLNDSMISAREAQISSEIARNAANDAKTSFEMTQKSLAMLQRLAVSLNARR